MIRPTTIATALKYINGAESVKLLANTVSTVQPNCGTANDVIAQMTEFVETFPQHQFSRTFIAKFIRYQRGELYDTRDYREAVDLRLINADDSEPVE